MQDVGTHTGEAYCMTQAQYTAKKLFAHGHIAEQTAFAVTTTQVKSDTVNTINMFKMMLRATGRAGKRLVL